MGMGLPICRSIIESYGGAIAGRNLDGGGAAFSAHAACRRAEYDHTRVLVR